MLSRFSLHLGLNSFEFAITIIIQEPLMLLSYFVIVLYSHLDLLFSFLQHLELIYFVLLCLAMLINLVFADKVD